MTNYDITKDHIPLTETEEAEWCAKGGLGKDSIEGLKEMLNSPDPENKKLAQEIIQLKIQQCS